MSNIVPFGKYKGQPVELMAADSQYVDWLTAQDWFKSRYANLYTVIINNFTEPSETPDHNKIQIRFLEESYRLKFAFLANVGMFGKCADLGKLLEKGLLYFKNKEQDEISESIASEIVREKEARDQNRRFWSQARSPKTILIESPSELKKWKYPDPLDVELFFLDISNPTFEEKGIDVVYDISFGFSLKIQYQENYILNCYKNKEFRVEIKPSISDDFPAVLRQMKNNKSNYLLVDSYSGVGATREQFIEYFKNEGKGVVFTQDIDDFILPEMCESVQINIVWDNLEQPKVSDVLRLFDGLIVNKITQ